MKDSSPTASTSSINSTSGSACTATENARRMYIPDEYVRTGSSITSARPAKSTMVSKRSSVSALLMPITRPFR